MYLINRAEFFGTLNRWKWPVFGATAAFFGSLYTFGFNRALTVHAGSGEEETSNSVGLRDLLQKWIHNFVQGPKGSEKPPMSPREASEILRKNEKSVNVNIGAVSYFETNSFASNTPCEDRANEWLLLKTNGTSFGVFDGHGGWQCAEMVKNRLPLYLAISFLSKSDLTILEKNLSRSFSKDDFVEILQDRSPAVESTSQSNFGYTLSQKQEVFQTGLKYFIKSLIEMPFEGRMPTQESLSLAFTQLDDDISTEAIPVKVIDDSFVAGASGTCALVSYIEGQHIFVANTGDCRAVLGSTKGDGSWLATPLSVDQTAENDDEVKRLRLEHPGEAFVLKNSRLLGQLQPLRSFGDIQYKWDKVTHSHVLTQVYGGPIVPPNMYITPPYLTARPVVTHHQLQPNDKFLILATDGLWDVLSNEQAVGLVANFLQQGRKDKENATALSDIKDARDEVLEQNAATHLIRHALGGNDHGYVAQMLLVPEQYRRIWRDDITVTVVIFDSDVFLSKL